MTKFIVFGVSIVLHSHVHTHKDIHAHSIDTTLDLRFALSLRATTKEIGFHGFIFVSSRFLLFFRLLLLGLDSYSRSMYVGSYIIIFFCEVQIDSPLISFYSIDIVHIRLVIHS